jgi:hypothetical protein
MPPTQKQQGDQAADKAEAKVENRTEAAKAAEPKSTDTKAADETTVTSAADASVPASATRVSGDVTVTEGASAPFTTKPDDVPVDPRTGQPFGDVKTDGLRGQHGMDLTGPGSVVPGVDPKAIPAEVTPGVTPDPGNNKLLAAAQAKAPSLTKEFVQKMGMSDEHLARIARGEEPPPPTPGPIYTADMYMTPGGFQQTPPGVPPEDVGKNSVAR